MKPQRIFDRYTRAKLGEKNPTVLDNFNDRVVNSTKYLHPRKGWRTFSVKRGKAAMITAEQKKGMFPPCIFAWQRIKNVLASGISA